MQESNDIRMNGGKIRQYKDLVEEFKSLCMLKGLVPEADNTYDDTIEIYGDEDVIYRLMNHGNKMFQQNYPGYPLPCAADDVQVMDDEREDGMFRLWWCKWMGISPTENPERTYEDARLCYSEDDDELAEIWKECGFDDPGKFLDVLILQIKDLNKFIKAF